MRSCWARCAARRAACGLLARAAAGPRREEGGGRSLHESSRSWQDSAFAAHQPASRVCPRLRVSLPLCGPPGPARNRPGERVAQLGHLRRGPRSAADGRKP
eukprot:scaffold1248_cov393-Prasinococcus_capsulatus_cf.AAC.31